MSFTLKRSDGVSGKPITISVEPFTLIGATTDIGMLPAPLRARFHYTFHLKPYSQDEAEAIITRAASKAEVEIEKDSVRILAERCQGTPRIALRLFHTALDLATVENSVIHEDLTYRAMDMLQVDHLGLDPADRRYLQVLAEVYQGRPVGPKAIAASCGMGELQVTETIEPYLLQKKLIARTRLGRQLTHAGWQHVFTFCPELQGIHYPVDDIELDQIEEELSEDMIPD